MSGTSALMRTRFASLSIPRPRSRPSCPTHSLRKHRAPRRLQSTQTPPPDPEAKQRSRLDRILNRTLKWLPFRSYFSRYVTGLRSAPLSHVFSFLILHEFTAVAPIFGLTALFHYTDYVPAEMVLGPWAAYAMQGLEKYGRYLRKKGWFGMGADEGGGGEELLERHVRDSAKDNEERSEREKRTGRQAGWWTTTNKRTEKEEWSNQRKDGTLDAQANELIDQAEDEVMDKKHRLRKAASQLRGVVTWGNTEKGYKFGVQLAAAYIITKVLLPVRLGLSLWATPWFARAMIATRKAVIGR